MNEMHKKWWIHAEDLVAVMVGPFDTEQEARDHVKFCDERGDGAEMEVLTGDLSRFNDLELITPQSDREYKVPRDFVREYGVDADPNWEKDE